MTPGQAIPSKRVRYELACCTPSYAPGPSGTALRHAKDCTRSPGSRVDETTARMLELQRKRDGAA